MFNIVEIKDIPFAYNDSVVFFGKSGCGKSFTIDYLLNNESYFLGLDKNRLVILDEIITGRNLVNFYLQMLNGKIVLAASHLPKFLFLPAYLFGKKIKLVSLDVKSDRIECFLQSRNLKYSPETLNRFIKKYRANFTDLEIIIELFPNQNFDISFYQFEKHGQIKLMPTSEENNN
jgi:hypothetical protein